MRPSIYIDTPEGNLDMFRSIWDELDMLEARLKSAADRMNGPLLVPFKRLSPEARVPTRGTSGAGCYDIYACDRITLNAEAPFPQKVRTGLAFQIPPGWCAVIYSRSSLFVKHGILITPMVIDSDYRGEVFVPLWACGPEHYEICPGDRIAQMKLERTQELRFEECDELGETERGAGGFGSTGR